MASLMLTFPFLLAILFGILIDCQVIDRVCSENIVDNIKQLYTGLGLELPNECTDLDCYCDWEQVTCGTTKSPTTGESEVIGLNFNGILSPNTEDGKSIFIPRDLVCLQSLETLDLSNNKFNNVVPAVLHDMVNLKKLSITDANLYGTIPTHFCYLKKMEELDLSNNYLSGEIPECVVAPPRLKTLNGSCNLLGGKIPNRVINVMSNNSGIKFDCNEKLILSESSNKLVNNTDNCDLCPNLDDLNGGCVFDKAIVGCEDNEYELIDPVLDICTSSVVPPEEEEEEVCIVEEDEECEEGAYDICNKPLVEIVADVFNAFVLDTVVVGEDTTIETLCQGTLECEGDVPISVTYTVDPDADLDPSLVFPQEIMCLEGLKKISINVPKYSSTFPEALCHLPNLEEISIIDTGIFGRIPDCIGNLENLKKLVINGAAIEGPFPTTIDGLTNITEIEIDCFRNGGVIPLSFYGNDQLQVKLTGTHIVHNDEVEEPDNAVNITINEVDDDTCIDTGAYIPIQSIDIEGCGEYEWISRKSGDDLIDAGTGKYYLCEGKEIWEVLKAVFDKLGLSERYKTGEDEATFNDSSICGWTGVRCTGEIFTLDLSNTGITTIPMELMCLTMMKSLILSDNPIETIPDDLDMITDLRYLNLENTKVKAIPESLCRADAPDQSVEINLCGTSLETPLPDCFSEFTHETEELGKCCHVRPGLVCPK